MDAIWMVIFIPSLLTGISGARYKYEKVYPAQPFELQKLVKRPLVIFFSSVLRLLGTPRDLSSSSYGTYSFTFVFLILILIFCVILPKNILILVCSRMKVKKSSSKASYVAKNSPSFCEIWLVNKGTLVWTKSAAESTSSVRTVSQSESAACILRSDKSGIISDSRGLWSMSARFCAGTITWDQAEADPRAAALSPTISGSMEKCGSHCLHSLSSPSSGCEQGTSLDSETKVEEESLCSQLEEVKIEAKASRNVAFVELLKRKKLEAEALEAIKKVNLSQEICFVALIV